LALKRPCLLHPMTRVLEQNEEAMNPEPLSGYVWLDTPGRCCMLRHHGSSSGSVRRMEGEEL
jgi:hypothetical protein